MRRERAARQLLAEPAQDTGTVVERLLAVQAQNWRATRLASRARTCDVARFADYT
ncbi:MAG: hypothetical protein M3P44_05500 [Actinomycetota bacterium]|nr:hypothetical protein [Actinomycetota bacterium]